MEHGVTYWNASTCRRTATLLMQHDDLLHILDFLRAAESLKTATRSGWTTAGERESVAEHSWRLCLMALVLHPGFPEVDFAKLIRICIVHDLGEAIGGDVPAPEQARLGASKAADERRDLLTLVAALPVPAVLQLVLVGRQRGIVRAGLQVAHLLGCGCLLGRERCRGGWRCGRCCLGPAGALERLDEELLEAFVDAFFVACARALQALEHVLARLLGHAIELGLFKVRDLELSTAKEPSVQAGESYPKGSMKPHDLE